MGKEQEFCEGLALKFPQLGNILNEHLEANEEILPHVFFGELTRYTLENSDKSTVIVQYLENSFVNDPAIENLIAVSFIENIGTEEDLERVLRNVEGTNLKTEWVGQNKS